MRIKPSPPSTGGAHNTDDVLAKRRQACSSTTGDAPPSRTPSSAGGPGAPRTSLNKLPLIATPNPASARPFDARVLGILRANQASLQGNERHGEGEHLRRVRGPDSTTYTVRVNASGRLPVTAGDDSGPDLELVPYGGGVLKVKDSTTGVGGTEEWQDFMNWDSSDGEMNADDAGETFAHAAARGRQLSNPDEPGRRDRRLRRQSPPSTQGLNTARLQTQWGLLQTYLGPGNLSQAQIDTLAQRFGQLRVSESDIATFAGTNRATSGIVNAANTSLSGGAGVNGAVQRGWGTVNGMTLAQWCSNHVPPDPQTGERCPTGSVRWSPGARLPVSHVFNAVGPRLAQRGDTPTTLQEQALQAAYQEAYRQARQTGIQDLAVPALSTGTFHYPCEDGTRVMMQEALQELLDHGTTTRLQLTSFNERGGVDPNYNALAYYWHQVHSTLAARASPGVALTATPPVPRAGATRQAATSRAATGDSAMRNARGQYAIRRPHLSQVVRAYYPPGTGYHHEVQQFANCGLHVHQQQLMLYSGNNFDLLASQAAVDQHIADLGADEVYASQELRDESVGQRQTNYQFDDLTRFTPPGAPTFTTVLGARMLNDGVLELPRNTHNDVTRRDIDRMPGIGVTLTMLNDRQERVQHSVQIIRLADDDAGNPRFIEVDPKRNPALPGYEPRRLNGGTMSEALEDLVSRIGVDTILMLQDLPHNQGRQFELHVPTPQTLQAYAAMNRPLPRPQVVPPTPTHATGRARRLLQTSSPGTVGDAPGGALQQASTSGERPGAQEPSANWLGEFLRGHLEPSLDALLDLHVVTDDTRPLVEHYAQTLWEHFGIYAHAPHYGPEHGEELLDDMERFERHGGSELLVTYNRQPQDESTTLLLLRDGQRWTQIDDSGVSTRVDDGLSAWLEQQLEHADHDGLRLLRRPPSTDEWIERWPSLDRSAVHKSAMGELVVERLRTDGVLLADLQGLGGERPSDEEFENVLLSMVARGALDNQHPVPTATDPDRVLDVREYVMQARERRQTLQRRLQREVDTLCELRQRVSDDDDDEVDAAQQTVTATRQEIRHDPQRPIQHLLDVVAPNGALPVDLNEFALMLPWSLTSSTVTKAVGDRPPEEVRTRTRRGRGRTLIDTNPAHAQQIRIRMAGDLPRFVVQHSPAPTSTDSAWNPNRSGTSTGGPLYAQNANMLSTYRNYMQREQRQRTLQYAQGIGPQPLAPGSVTNRDRSSCKLVRDVEHSVAPLSRNPLAMRDGALVLKAAAKAAERPDPVLTQQLGLVTWAPDNFEAVRQTRQASGPTSRRIVPAGPAWFRMPDLSGLSGDHRDAAEAAVNVLRAYRVLHPQASLSDGYFGELMRGYVEGLARLQQTTLPVRLVQDPAIVPNADLELALAAFGRAASLDAVQDRAALVQLAQQPAGEGMAHPAQLSRAIFLQLPISLQSALFEGGRKIDSRMRIAFNMIDYTEIQSSVLKDYSPRLVAHQSLLHALDTDESLGPDERKLAKRAMSALDQSWTQAQPLTLFDVAENETLLPAAIHRQLNLGRGADRRALKSWSLVRAWVNGQDFAPRTAPTLQFNSQLLQAFTGQIEDPREQREAHGVILQWMQAVEDRQMRNLQANPVWTQFRNAGDEAAFLDSAFTVLHPLWRSRELGLPEDEQRWMRQLYRWWSSATSQAPSEQPGPE